MVAQLYGIGQDSASRRWPRGRVRRVEPGAVVIADNVLSHEETLGAYSRARQGDPNLESVTVPLDRGLELSTVLRNR